MAFHDDFDTFAIPGFYYSADNKRAIAGHKRIFGDRPLKGWCFYLYNEQAPGWAIHRRWNFGLFCIHHVGPDKATDPEGWNITFAKLKFKKSYRGFTMTWTLADTFKTEKKL